MGYPAKRKAAILQKMLPPNNKPIAQLAEEEGIAQGTLYSWRAEARAKGKLMPDGDLSPKGWASVDKFAAVLETAALNESELSVYCRKRGLYPNQIKQWRIACEQANDWDRAQNKRLQDTTRNADKKIKALQKELIRKEKALAETAALLVLRKKAQAIWEESEDE